METNANVVAKARKFALLATFGSFVASAPLLPPPLSLFWECSSFGMRELVLVTLAVVVGIMLLARLTCGVRGSRAWFGVICGYVVFAFVRCLGMLGIVDACFVVLQSALFVLAFSMFIKEISEFRFGEALGIVSGSIALAFLLVLPCSLAPSSTIPGLRAAFASVGCAYLLFISRPSCAYALCDVCDSSGRASGEPSKRLPLGRVKTVSMVAEYCSGLFLLAMSVVARTPAYASGSIPQEYRLFELLALPLGALFLIGMLLAKRGRMELSLVNGEYLPQFAAAFFILSAFGAETPLFGVGFLLSQAALGAAGVLAFASLASRWARGEASMAAAVGAVFMGFLASDALGLAIGEFVDQRRVGVVLLITASMYFAYVMLRALSDTRKLVESMAHSSEVAACADGPLCAGKLREVCARLSDEKKLTPREREVLLYVACGHNSPYIASKLVISEYTVRTHMRNAYRKIGVSSKEELIQLIEARHE